MRAALAREAPLPALTCVLSGRSWFLFEHGRRINPIDMENKAIPMQQGHE